MKYIKQILFLSLFAMLTACSEDAFVPQPEEVLSSGKSIKTINIVVPDMQYDATTRSDLVEENDKLYFKWEEGDAAGVFPQIGSQVKFPVTSESVGGSSALFDGGQWALRSDGQYAAYFPYDINNEGISEIAVDYTGQTQENFDEYDFMATGAITPVNGQITFKMQRVSAILKFEIQMEANTYGRFGRLYMSPEKMGVKGVMDLSGDAPAFIPSEYSNYIETDLLKDSTDVKQWTYTAYMLIPPVNMEGKTLTFRISSNKNEDVYEAVIEGKNFEAGKAYKLEGVAEGAKIRNLNLIAVAEDSYYNEGVSFTKDENGFVNVIENRDELAKVKCIDVSLKQDSTVCDEIGYFPNLTELNCYYNKLTSLDVSKNTALTILNCYANQLTSLDISNNTNLTELQCGNNKLAELDVSHNTALTSLQCGSNQLTELDVSHNTALTYLHCSFNKMTELDITKNVALTSLICTDGQLTSIDLSNNTELIEIWLYRNKLTSLDVSKNTALKTMIIWDNQLTSLDVSNNTALELLQPAQNKLTSLDVSNNTELTNLNCYMNQLISLDISNNTKLTNLDCSYNQLTALDVSNNRFLKTLYCYSNQLSELDITNNLGLALSKVICGDQPQTLSLKVISAQNEESSLPEGGNTNVSIVVLDGPTSPVMTNLYLIAAAEANEGVSFVKKADGTVNVEDNLEELAKVTEINVFSVSDPTVCYEIIFFPNLESLYCGKNQLTSLNLSKNTALKTLDCQNNQLISLNLSNNTALESLDCHSNRLASLDVSNNTALKNLECNSNKLTSLDVSNNTALISLNCQFNQLTSLDVSNNTSLASLDFLQNQLTSLDVSNNTELIWLNCSWNKLTSLDVSNNTALIFMNCNYNQLTSLDISSNTAIQTVYCDNNQLATLDVSNNTELEVLHCFKNHLSVLNIALCTKLTMTNIICGKQIDTSEVDQTITLFVNATQYADKDQLGPGYNNANVTIVQEE